MTAYVSNDKDALKVLSTNSRGKNQMKILKYLCILRNEKDLNEYVRKNQNNSFADDQRTITKNIKFIRDVFDDYGQLDIYFNLSIKYMKDISIW